MKAKAAIDEPKGTRSTTERAIAKHLGVDATTVHDFLVAENLAARDIDLTTARLIFIKRLRKIAAGLKAQDGSDLIAARARNETLDAELKQLNLFEKRGVLVSLETLEPVLSQMVGSFKTELVGMADKLKTELDALHGIDCELAFIEDHIRTALGQMSRYDPGRARAGAPARAAAGAGVKDVDERVEPGLSADVGKVDGAAR